MTFFRTYSYYTNVSLSIIFKLNNQDGKKSNLQCNKVVCTREPGHLRLENSVATIMYDFFNNFSQNKDFVMSFILSTYKDRSSNSVSLMKSQKTCKSRDTHTNRVSGKPVSTNIKVPNYEIHKTKPLN